MKRILARLACAGLAALCAGGAGAETLIGYVAPIATQPGQQYLQKGMERAAAELGFETRTLDANLSSDRQVSHLDTLLTMGAKAIGTWSMDPNAVAGVFARAGEQGVPVIGVNSPGEGVTATVYWDINRCTGDGPFVQQAAYIAARKPGARVVIMGGPPVPSIMQNMDCATRTSEAAGLEVVDRVDNAKDSASNAATLAADELVRFPDVDVFVAYNDATALGISAALLASGRSIYGAAGTEGVMVFGMNGDVDAIEALKDGRLTATWDPDPHATGFAVAKAMAAALEAPGAKQPDLIVKTQFVDYEGVGAWRDGLERGYTLATIPLVE